MEQQTDAIQLRIASFLAQALELEDEPAILAVELIALKQDRNAGIWTIEMESTVGSAAFLVYNYRMMTVGDDGRPGRELFEADLATLERAADRDSPGPRILAHAVAGDEAFILATTPATFRALTGNVAGDDLRAPASDPIPAEFAIQTRRESAEELLRVLPIANQHAQRWLAAVRSEGQSSSDATDDERTIVFNAEETALALFLLDERSIQHLLRVLNLLLETAHLQAAEAVPRPD